MLLKRELAIFFVVGISALLVHLFIVWLLVNMGHWKPLNANILGFLGAVNLSYFGHSQLTFNQRTSLSLWAFAKFFSIACTSFVINQITYFYGLKWFGNSFYLPILAAVLLLVALFTFVFSKFWVFTAHEPAKP